MFGSIDIFCDVIDNFGDAGVTYRLARSLKKELPDSDIRVFTNGLEAFSAIGAGIIHKKEDQTAGGIRFISYNILTEKFVNGYEIPGLVIEAFACRIPEAYYEKAIGSDCLIINIDHLSAEEWIEGVHLKESLTGRKAKKYFFMPGFTVNSGGILQDRELNEGELKEKRKYFEKLFRVDNESLMISVFTYEHDFSRFFSDLKSTGKKFSLIIFGEKSRESISKPDAVPDNVKLINSGFLHQTEYDALLKICDLNFVRGEDSWARACLSKKPFVWHAYQQKDNYQLVKVKAFLEYLKRFFSDKEVFRQYSSYMLKFNDRNTETIDDSALFMLQNIESFGLYNISSSEFLIKNCNLINNLLFFARSLKEDKKLK